MARGGKETTHAGESCYEIGCVDGARSGAGWLLGSLSVLAQEIRQPIERNGRVKVLCQVGEVTVTGGDEAVLTVTTDGNPSMVKVKQLADGAYGISVDPPMMPHRLRITVPREASLQEVRTRNANVTVRAVAAANVTTVSGGVLVEQVPGPVNVATTSGRVRLTEVGTVQLRTVSGDTQVQAVTGSVMVSAVSGKLEASTLGGPDSPARQWQCQHPVQPGPG
ncbi:DUF4097 family beta strand repeat-containing protein [Chloracidobacterium thermophilum]|uniref:DUF4097 family beta strand repeat-containing protein n=1 Tax=Chloracidobacterium thermophilum TaxID=458033 RepID=UPI001BB2E561|nr:DUF4097 family beta strand repeat-containing protein [Chloracidobacterium thermophilum]QUV80457.1 hypothetical protein J8C08_12700 [Chloracidobacterium thermophilum]